MTRETNDCLAGCLEVVVGVAGFEPTTPSPKTEAFFWDAETPGLALRAYPSGKRVWLCQYRDQHGRTRRVPLGQVGVVDPASARKAAREALHRVAGGANPALERKATRTATNVGWLIDAYLQHAERKLKPGTLDQTQRNLRKYAGSLHGDAVAIVDRAAIFRLHPCRRCGPGRCMRAL